MVKVPLEVELKINKAQAKKEIEGMLKGITVNATAGVSKMAGGSKAKGAGLPSKAIKGLISLSILSAGINQMTELMSKVVGFLSKSSPRLAGVLKIFEKAMMIFFRPFGDFLASLLIPFVKIFLKWVIQFKKTMKDIFKPILEPIKQVAKSIIEKGQAIITGKEAPGKVIKKALTDAGETIKKESKKFFENIPDVKFTQVADIDKGISTFLDDVETGATIFIEGIFAAFEGLVKYLIDNGPEIVTLIIGAFIRIIGFLDRIKIVIVTEFIKAVIGIISYIIDNRATIVSDFFTMFVTLGGILFEEGKKTIGVIISSLGELGPEFLALGNKIITAITTDFSVFAGNLALGFNTWLEGVIEDIGEFGRDVLIAFTKWIGGVITFIGNFGQIMKDKLVEMWNDAMTFFSGIGTQLIGMLITAVQNGLKTITNLGKMIADAIIGAISGALGGIGAGILSFFTGGGGTTGDVVPDFISRPGQGVQKFSPDDTIIGVKDPGALGGGGSFSVTINNPQFNSDADVERMAELLAEKTREKLRGKVSYF